MNKKGFTLVELLATIVIVGLVGGIAATGVTNAINNSKLKSEKIFLDKLSNLVDDYLDLYGSQLKETTISYTFKKCTKSSCDTDEDENNYEVTATKMQPSTSLKDLIDNEIITKDKLINPKNKKQCFSTTNPEIVIYKDSDYVYYYYIDLENNDCEIDEKNIVLDNMPENLINELINGTDPISNNLKNKYK